MKFAVQLYTLRESIHNGEELIAALEQVKRLGYEGVEFAGFFDLPAAKLKAELDRIGLTAVCAHTGDDLLGARLSETLDYAQTLGMRWLALPYSVTDTVPQLEDTLAMLRTAAEEAAKRGIQILYHNHWHEFALLEGTRPLDRIEAECMLEPDCYWVFAAGENPVEFLRGHRARIGVIHLKDGDGTFEGLTALGEGKNNIAALVAAARELEIPWGIVENDLPKPDGLDNIARSMNFLRTL